MNKKLFLNFLIISIFLHGLVASVFFFQKKEEHKIKTLPIALELKHLPSGSLQGSTPQSTKNKLKLNSRPKQKSYFGSSFKTLAEKAEQGIAAGDTFLKDRKQDDPNAPWGQGTETFERIEDYTLFKSLYSRIDSSLSYPQVLAKNKIQGVVNARFVLNKSGECDWGYTQILGKDPYLRLYVLDLLKRVCQENFKRYIKDRIVTNVDLSFDFAISENGDKEYEKEHQAIIGNTMAFYRNSHHSVLQWELGPFKGMFPVPAVYLNIEWIQENWDRLLHGKEPLKEFKKRFG